VNAVGVLITTSMGDVTSNSYGKTEVEKEGVPGKLIIKVALAETRFPTVKYCAGSVIT